MFTTDPLAGPFPPACLLTRYDDEPGYPIRLPDMTPSRVISGVLARLDRIAETRKAAA